MMTKSTVVAVVLFSLTIGTGAALAQNPPPATGHAAAGTTDKQAISKACSDQANAKGSMARSAKSSERNASVRAARSNSRSCPAANC
jgi:hypothetical protein